MELFATLIGMIFLAWLLFPLVRASSGTGQLHDSSKVPIKHGHRCYAEGLNRSEAEVVRLLSHNLSHKDYFIFNNLIIPSENSKSTQIDHVVVSRFGVFVIETKECNGWLFAHHNHEEWIVTYKHGVKHRTPNPQWQNYGHIQCLKKEMPFVEDNIYGVIVYVGAVQFKTPRISNVITIDELLSLISTYTAPKISEQRLLMAIGKLSYMCQAVDITPEQHIANIKQVIEARV